MPAVAGFVAGNAQEECDNIKAALQISSRVTDLCGLEISCNSGSISCPLLRLVTLTVLMKFIYLF